MGNNPVGTYFCPSCGRMHGGGPAGGDTCSACTYKQDHPKEKAPWFQINHARTKIIEQQLTRIANALDAILEEAYDRYMTPPKADTSGREPEVMYTDQDKYDIDEMVERVKEEESER